ncbi:hypothetical protein [Moraxella bovoculi]|nr:hypothetical protein [Moraxella bovoculi]
MNTLKNLLGMTALTMMMIVFSSLFLRACDREYEIDRERIEQYKMEIKQ